MEHPQSDGFEDYLLELQQENDSDVCKIQKNAIHKNNLMESAKLRVWRAYMLGVFTCFCAWCACVCTCVLVMMKCFIFLHVCVLGVLFCLICFTF